MRQEITRKLAIKLLRMAAEHYSCRGCNDFHLESDGGLNVEEIEELRREELDDGSPVVLDNGYSMDWVLMWLVVKELEAGQKGGRA